MASAQLPVATSAASDPERWADATSRELLALQAQNRKLTAEQRTELVEQSLRERIASVAESQRRSHLRSLAARFPLHESNGAHPAAEKAPATAADWVAGFDGIRDGMSAELQKALLDKLKDAGCLPPPPSPTVAGIPMPGAIEGLLPKEPIDPARVAQLVDVVVEAMRALDGNFRKIWEGVADFGKTDHGLPRQSFEEVIRKFLAGDQDVPRVVLKSRVETTTKLIPAVLMAVKESWDTMEADVANCLPEEIQKRVKKTTFGYETGCWKEFTKAAERLHPDTRVREFFDQIVSKARAHIPR